MMTMALLLATTAGAKVRMPQLFQDGMVLQRGVDIPVWGWADKSERVVVSLADGKGKVLTTASATADDNGCWTLTLPRNKKMKAGEGYTLEVKGAEAAADKLDVALGDVWLLSGQSNIDVTIERVYPWYVKEIDAFDNPQVRLFRVQNDTDTHGPKDDIRPTSINWKPLTKQNAWLFSAVGSFFGQRMQQATGVPQGIIVNSWGGTPIEAWISADYLQADFPELIEKTRLYQNDEYVRTQSRANMLMNQQWSRILDEKDPGKKDDFTALDYDDSNWQEVDQYSMEWAKNGGRGIIGSIWLRQHVNIDKVHAGKPARLLLGTLFDSDVTYVNGRQVGTTGYQYPPRRYDIPEGLLREGDNVITVRFINKYGTVHFIKEKPYCLAFGDDRFSLNPMPVDVVPLSTKWKRHAGANMPSCPSSDVSLQNMPTTLYNAVLHPLAPMALAGVVWYQGESNTGADARNYAPMLRMLMQNWRERFAQPYLPFVIVQLANYMDCVPQPQNTGWSVVREAQRTVADADPYAESVVNIDLGETVDIHPLRKKEVAERIGLCFDRLVFGKKVNLFPRVVAHEVKDGTVVLTLDQPLRPGTLKYFELADGGGRFHNADASAQGNIIRVTVPTGMANGSPTALRYAWKDNPLGADAYSLDGLPLSPFELKL
ncbi:MAG: sialate O-acetylesterase [Prevotella sp.]|nr:sialate O-acetylesterase [Prevotella sp.]